MTILIVNYNTADFIEFSLKILQKLTKNSYRVDILDNNSKIKDYQKLKRIVTEYDNVYLERAETDLTGSAAHGAGVNHLCRKVKTPYFVILDPDANWLRKNWDEILINQFDDRIKAAGTQAPVGSKKYQDFPLVFAMIFETEVFKKLNIDCWPKDPSKQQDVCYELREKFLQAGYWAKNIEMKNTRTYHDGPFRNVICAEYYLDQDYQNIFTSHFARGSTLGANKYQKGIRKYIYQIPIIGKFLLARKGEKEKRQWLDICWQITEEQCKKLTTSN